MYREHILFLTAASVLLLLPATYYAQEAAANPSACLRDNFLRNRTYERIYSQYEEDGILEAIYECIGTTDKRYVEVIS